MEEGNSYPLRRAFESISRLRRRFDMPAVIRQWYDQLAYNGSHA
mgnify:CR=1 FL=1